MDGKIMSIEVESNKKLFIIDAKLNKEKLYELENNNFDKNTVVLFFGDDLKWLQQNLVKKNNNVKIINATGLLEKYALKVRKNYHSVVRNSQEIKLQDKNLDIKSFLSLNNVSTWWFSEIFHKRSYTYKTVSNLTQLELINDIILHYNLSNIHFLIRNDALLYLVKQLCQIKNIKFNSKIIKNSFYIRKFSFFFSILSFSIFTIKLLIFTFFLKKNVNKKIYKNKIVFIQFIKNFSSKSKNVFAEKFGNDNEIIKKFSNTAINIYSLIPDGIHPTIRLSMIKMFFRKEQSLEILNNNIDSYISYKEIFEIYINGISIIKKYNVLLNTSEYINHWKYLGINIFPLIYKEHLSCMIRVPRYFFYIKKLKNYLKMSKPSILLYNMFELPIGKATIYATQNVSPSTIIVACQEGPLSKLKLESLYSKSDFSNTISKDKNYIKSMPSPDYLFLEGAYYKNIMVESGYPKERIILVGAPRLMNFCSLPFFDNNFENKKILVTLGANDGEEILSRCIKIHEIENNLKFIIKVHPRGKIGINNVKKILKLNNINSGFEISNKSFMELLRDVYCVVGTFSSTLIESASKRYPTILLLFSNQINTSSLIDIKDPNVYLCKSAEQFIEIIYSIRNKTNFHSYNKIMKLFFHNENKNIEKLWYDNINTLNNLSFTDK